MSAGRVPAFLLEPVVEIANSTKQLMKNLKSKLAMLAAFATIGVTFAVAAATGSLSPAFA
ncbi:MAG: hypothetical protein M3258_09645 [Thermoproteota archaeon]|nr:hypothetical protein [Thermoproteota archaeon]